jgi:phage head maturation protease
MTTRTPPDLIQRAATFEPASFDAEARTIDLVWSTGADVERSDWSTGSRFIERMSMKPSDGKLARLNAGAPLLDSHDSYSSRSIIGAVVPGTAAIRNGLGVATVRLSSASDVADAVTKIGEGILRNVSFGYRLIGEPTVTAAKKGAPEVREWAEWEAHELSMVPIPADAGAQTRAMPAQVESPMSEPTVPANVIDLDAVRAEAKATERTRVSAINDLGKRHGVDVAAFVDGDKSVDAVRAHILDSLAAKSAVQDVQGTHRAASVKTDHADQVRAGIANAIEFRSGLKGAVLTDAGRAHAQLSLVRMAETMLRQQGVDVSTMGNREIARMAMRGAGGDLSQRSFAGAMATGDFPFLLANVANKFLLEGYAAEPMSHEAFSYSRTVSDLKQVSGVRLGSIAALPKVVEGAEYTYASTGEEREVYTVAKYGAILPFTLEAFVNDDLGGFKIEADEMGRAAARAELGVAYSVFTDNSGGGQTMGDSTDLFTSAHGNLDAATALSAANLDTARTLLRNQTDLTGNFVGSAPAILLVNSALEGTADRIVNGSYFPTTDATATIGAYRSLQVVVEPRLNALSATVFYLMTARKWIEIGKLAGYESPMIEMIEQKDADQIGYKARYFVAAKAMDWRQVVRNPGA